MMKLLVALLDHFHPKFKGGVSGAAVAAAVIALLVALGVSLTDAEKDIIIGVFTSLATYFAPPGAQASPGD